MWNEEKVSNFEIAVAKLKETLRNIKFATLCRYNIKNSSDGGGKASPILEKLEIFSDGPQGSVVQSPRRSVPYFASMVIEAFLHVQFVPVTPK